jgi:hypothetical protein
MEFRFHTRLSLPECQQLIHQALNPKRGIFEWLFGPNTLVAGKIKGSKFHIYRRPHSQNMFFPFFSGTLKPEPVGTWVEVTVRFPIAAIILTAFFLLLGLLFQLNNLFTTDEVASLASWLVFLGPLLASGLISTTILGVSVFTYRRDCAFMEKYLKRILRA